MIEQLMRSSEIAKRPVVTFTGEDISQIKDIIYAPDGGAVAGFTLAGRGLFSGPRKEVLPWRSVAALGPDAVMILREDMLSPAGEMFTAPDAGDDTPQPSHERRGDILGSTVLTDSGIELGAVVDVIIEVSGRYGGKCEVVGYEIKSSEAMKNKGTTVLIPLPDTLAASGEHLMVPASATDFVRDDLAGFGAAVDAFRAQLGGKN
ncbi:PRC-barrel domain containing protein [Rhodococcus sp. PAMC28707]|uniref:PRC-barrel domain-containing protein n=1 Tax=unclassified Rhodococcus (in: high G+C Gram-positive bacteria) TaxID=192944 RepID=UPI00109DFE06|nr:MULTISPECIES: PRC-barrel domain-containing protein [unclassified Rhodococcus (in: high G+C Gram-positive bacteria)]QCB50421.1 PRC-barrel domain containing protein [Rhodococcus sp. PAMC28705]QCB57887.1 PRC-barrel domain containing protein [Rhodococcus sp. PAMC28707]